MNEKIEIYKLNLDSRKDSIKSWNIPESVKKDLINFLSDLEIGKINKGKKTGARTQLKYISTLRVSLEHLNKPLTSITLKDLENFDRGITSGNIKSKKNKPYSHAVKADIRIALRMLLRWKLGYEKANKLTDWFDCRDIDKTPDFLSENEIEKLYKNCKSIQEKFLIAVLFDSGARIEEFLNIRYEDIKQPTNAHNFFKITFKEEYSKTKGRNISLYWKHSNEAVKDFVEQRIREGIRTDEAVYNSTYAASRAFLRRLGFKVLNKGIHPHLFRHSSATYYANKLNRQELCIRYGWKFSSDMPDVYISRAGMENKELDEKFTQTELGELKTKLEKQDMENKIKAGKMQDVEKELDTVRKEKEVSDKKMQELTSKFDYLEKDLNKRKQLDPILNELVKNKSAIKIIRHIIENYEEDLVEIKASEKSGVGKGNATRVTH